MCTDQDTNLLYRTKGKHSLRAALTQFQLLRVHDLKWSDQSQYKKEAGYIYYNREAIYGVNDIIWQIKNRVHSVK